MSALAQADLLNTEPDVLLSAFVTGFNELTEQFDEQGTLINLLRQELDSYKRLNVSKTNEIESLKQALNSHSQQAASNEQLQQQIVGLTKEKAQYKTQLSTLQSEFSKLKGGDNPARLKAQIKRLKEANAKHQARVKTLERDLSNYRKQAKKATNTIESLQLDNSQLNKQLAHDTGSGLYHNDEHHLIIWPQKTKMQRSDGSTFEGRSLLYLHQSGRGGLIGYDPEIGSKLCAAPKGGIRPNSDTMAFAKDWLFKVNELQSGLVKEEDMQPVNYNGKQQ